MAIKLMTAFGVPIYLDYSWFLIFALIVWTVGFGLMPTSYPNLSSIEYLTIGVFSAVLLFFSIVVHELAHSIVARGSGLQIGKITLFLFGGVSEMEGGPTNPDVELKMAAAGPLTSIAIGVITGGLWILSANLNAPALVQAPLYYSFLVNVIVAAFNLIPAFPMDGGRILRSLMWKFNHDFIKSTKTATTVGRVFAYLIMGAGIFAILAIDFFTGIWLLLIGWFISSGASSELTQTLVQQDLANLKARDMMTRNVDSVLPNITLTDLSLEFLNRKHNGFPVISNDELIGCVAMEDLRKVKRENWNSVNVRDIMIPKERLVTIRETDPALNVLTLMNKNKIGRVYVLDPASGKLSGIITRSDVIKTIQMEESIFGRQSYLPSAGPVITVEQGMMFEIETPRDGGADWSAGFNNSEFALVSEKVLQLSDSGQSKQFTFQALQKGRFSINLALGTAQTGSPTGTTVRSQKQIKYTIIVN